MYAVAFSEARNVVGVPARISPHSSTVTVEPDGVNLRSPMGDTVWRVFATVMAGVCEPVELLFSYAINSRIISNGHKLH